MALGLFVILVIVVRLPTPRAAQLAAIGRYKEKVMVKVHAIQTGKVKIK